MGRFNQSIFYLLDSVALSSMCHESYLIPNKSLGIQLALFCTNDVIMVRKMTMLILIYQSQRIIIDQVYNSLLLSYRCHESYLIPTECGCLSLLYRVVHIRKFYKIWQSIVQLRFFFTIAQRSMNISTYSILYHVNK